MEQFIDFFATMPTYYKLLWIFICLAICWVAEGAVPLFSLSYNKWRHDGINLVFLLSTIVINVGFGAATAGILVAAQQQQWGLLYQITLPLWAKLILSVLLLDFIAQWLAHYLLHRVKWMWKLHLVHHSDTKVDATTGTRHHPGDYFIREIFSLATVLLFGIPASFYVFYRITTVFFTYFTHANIVLPALIDKTLSWVFITPNMHKFHHHFERPWTDSNFGNIFSFWDRILGTLVYDNPQKVRYGVDVLEGTDDENIMYQLNIPFDGGIKTDY